MNNILMYSGGLDSFIISRTFKFDHIVFAELGNEDNNREWERVNADPFFKEIIRVDLPLDRFELENKIIPYRNHMLALLGAQYGNNIFFGFTGGDTTKDKDFVFKAQMEGILNYFALDKHKVRHLGYPYVIHMPYKEASKGEMVAEYLRQGNPVEDLWTISRSCYSGGRKECGHCRSCLRKAVSLAVNGVVGLENIFERDPYHYLANFLIECKDKGRFEKEIKEITAAINHEVLYTESIFPAPLPVTNI
jgi:7-cyano-7-deazaguanine synthase